jgi:outer membrane protein OmpA-like peptidoglycan-associated protein
MAFELTQNRANVVRDMLAQRGVNQDILKPIGYGYSKPIINNNDMSKKRFNNRIVLRVVEMD